MRALATREEVEKWKISSSSPSKGLRRGDHCHSNDLYARLKLGRPGEALLSLSFSLPSSLPSIVSFSQPPKSGRTAAVLCVSTYSNETRGSADSRGEKGRGKKFGSPRGVERRGAVGKSPEHMQIRVSTDATCNVRTYMYGESFRPVFLPDHDRARAADPWLERERERHDDDDEPNTEKRPRGETRRPFDCSPLIRVTR